MIRVDTDDPELESQLDSRVTYRGEYFTGEVTEMNGDVMVALTTYRDGFEDGPSVEWFPGGGKLSEGVVRKGIPVGPWRMWHVNGELAEEKVFDEAGTGCVVRIRRWSERGDPLPQRSSQG
ncbi:hypothetical protein SCATT_14350 [Streptantibioticus cattleyicolor NRRL 8057 = DSM 46488]|uniref:Uncharacterized protein n=2 Tax=Kitasatosporales TaxID=85011 RepID=F8JYQ1_STREN|nr:hypothetical protein SCATT_14350 [Streptantibioticus cattleyicolor NRRL 8057 = DSM 46488]MYS58492.1 hypothetical protein [Streptomyces sp. SID5468]CCB74152.1 conserved protein of unknown function [Streptantibioticus cattleyicolor NRRL 8057 = DSM 46488]